MTKLIAFANGTGGVSLTSCPPGEDIEALLVAAPQGAVLVDESELPAGPSEAWKIEGGVLSISTAKQSVMTRAALQAEIDRLERDSMMNRGVRELSLRQMEFFAVQLGQDLETIPAYVKFKALDDQVSALRIQLAELEAQS